MNKDLHIQIPLDIYKKAAHKAIEKNVTLTKIIIIALISFLEGDEK